MKEITYTPEARKTLRRIPSADARRIRSKIEQYATNPASLANNISALKGSPYIRLRIGDWRVIMNDQGVVVIVVKVGPRGGIYD